MTHPQTNRDKLIEAFETALDIMIEHESEGAEFDLTPSDENFKIRVRIDLRPADEPL